MQYRKIRHKWHHKKQENKAWTQRSNSTVFVSIWKSLTHTKMEAQSHSSRLSMPGNSGLKGLRVSSETTQHSRKRLPIYENFFQKLPKKLPPQSAFAHSTKTVLFERTTRTTLRERPYAPCISSQHHRKNHVTTFVHLTSSHQTYGSKFVEKAIVINRTIKSRCVRLAKHNLHGPAHRITAL